MYDTKHFRHLCMKQQRQLKVTLYNRVINYKKQTITTQRFQNISKKKHQIKVYDNKKKEWAKFHDKINRVLIAELSLSPQTLLIKLLYGKL